ncbi:MAG: TIGR00725 family protein [Actinobacteria bacterium]|nr:TIGR00725 family protein [Actinomycetota bacterium]
MHVGVIGSQHAAGAIEALGEEVGRGVGRRGGVLVCGGLTGVMAAACRGAKDGGGTTVGILPGLDRAAANPWVDVALPTGLGEVRNILVVRASDVIVAVDGSHGTLSEIAFALKQATPVIGLRTWALTAGDAEDPDPGVTVVDGADEAVEAAFRAAELAGQPPTSPA